MRGGGGLPGKSAYFLRAAHVFPQTGVLTIKGRCACTHFFLGPRVLPCPPSVLPCLCPPVSSRVLRVSSLCPPCVLPCPPCVLLVSSFCPPVSSLCLAVSSRVIPVSSRVLRVLRCPPVSFRVFSYPLCPPVSSLCPPISSQCHSLLNRRGKMVPPVVLLLGLRRPARFGPAVLGRSARMSERGRTRPPDRMHARGVPSNVSVSL